MKQTDTDTVMIKNELLLSQMVFPHSSWTKSCMCCSSACNCLMLHGLQKRLWLVFGYVSKKMIQILLDIQQDHKSTRGLQLHDLSLTEGWLKRTRMLLISVFNHVSSCIHEWPAIWKPKCCIAHLFPKLSIGLVLLGQSCTNSAQLFRHKPSSNPDTVGMSFVWVQPRPWPGASTPTAQSLAALAWLVIVELWLGTTGTTGPPRRRLELGLCLCRSCCGCGCRGLWGHFQLALTENAPMTKLRFGRCGFGLWLTINCSLGFGLGFGLATWSWLGFHNLLYARRGWQSFNGKCCGQAGLHGLWCLWYLWYLWCHRLNRHLGGWPQLWSLIWWSQSKVWSSLWNWWLWCLFIHPNHGLLALSTFSRLGQHPTTVGTEGPIGGCFHLVFDQGIHLWTTKGGSPSSWQLTNIPSVLGLMPNGFLPPSIRWCQVQLWCVPATAAACGRVDHGIHAPRPLGNSACSKTRNGNVKPMLLVSSFALTKSWLPHHVKPSMLPSFLVIEIGWLNNWVATCIPAWIFWGPCQRPAAGTTLSTSGQ